MDAAQISSYLKQDSKHDPSSKATDYVTAPKPDTEWQLCVQTPTI